MTPHHFRCVGLATLILWDRGAAQSYQRSASTARERRSRKGMTVRSEDDRASMTIRARLQIRTTFVANQDDALTACLFYN
jgi:hypothetical protein